jgi:hypothetical protein
VAEVGAEGLPAWGITAAGGGCRGGADSGEGAARGGQCASRGCQVIARGGAE